MLQRSPAPQVTEEHDGSSPSQAAKLIYQKSKIKLDITVKDCIIVILSWAAPTEIRKMEVAGT